MNKFKALAIRLLEGKHGEFLRYALVGAVTVFINFFVYTLFYSVFKINVNVSNTCSVICANTYSYIGNKRQVFHSHNKNFWGLLRELLLFFSGRAMTILIEIFGVAIVVSAFDVSPFWGKVEVVVFVIIVNYLLTKFVVFRHRGK